MSGENSRRRPRRRIVALLDGTWLVLADGTNVALFHHYLEEGRNENDGVEQIKKHFPGVGTSSRFGWVGKLLDGAFGYGLDEPIKKSFKWLSENYEPGDEIFVFGFSRGAYSARSLVGLMHKVGGVLENPTDYLVDKAYDLYRDAKQDATDFRKRVDVVKARVKMIGVWDTVGALGIPVTGLPLAFPGTRGYYRFHDTNLSCIVDEAYHALAIDEYRADFAPTLWDATTSDDQTVEQCWFVGDHGDIGGGHPNSKLWVLPYVWMQDKAIAAGLRFTERLYARQEWWQTPNNSFGSFLFGLYRIYKLGMRYFRELGRRVEEVLHPSVLARVAASLKYRPRPLTNAGIPERTHQLTRRHDVKPCLHAW